MQMAISVNYAALISVFKIHPKPLRRIGGRFIVHRLYLAIRFFVQLLRFDVLIVRQASAPFFASGRKS